MYRDGDGEPPPSLDRFACAPYFFSGYPGAGLSADERQLTVLIGLSPSPGTPRTAPTLSATEVSLSPYICHGSPGELFRDLPNEQSPV